MENLSVQIWNFCSHYISWVVTHTSNSLTRISKLINRVQSDGYLIAKTRTVVMEIFFYVPTFYTSLFSLTTYGSVNFYLSFLLGKVYGVPSSLNIEMVSLIWVLRTGKRVDTNDKMKSDLELCLVKPCFYVYSKNY